METVKSNVKIVLKQSKSKIELKQAIANLSRQNDGGQYDERISLYQKELEQYESFPVSNVTVHQSSPSEMAAIMLFNNDKRFLITE